MCSVPQMPGRGFAVAFAAACIAFAPVPAFAQGYPEKPIHVIVAFAPGGPVDVVARLVAVKLADILGQPVVLEKPPSTSGHPRTQVGAKSQTAGHTSPATPSPFAANGTLSPNAGYVSCAFAPLLP